MIEAKIILDSKNPYSGVRLTTFELIYPRFIHAEVLTHRLFSRSSASSRAIPVKKMIASIDAEPAMPIHWGKNQKGMSAFQENDEKLCIPVFSQELGKFDVTMTPQEAWLHAKDLMIEVASAYERAGYHKQIVNRLLEPFAHMKVCLTSSYFDNFFDLRTNIETAQPEIVELARKMLEAMNSSNPVERVIHKPWLSEEEERFLSHNDSIMVSIARSARVSYETFETGKKSDVESDKRLYHRLFEELHLSPFEHVATALEHSWEKNSNFHESWLQERKIVEKLKNVNTYI